MWGSQVGAAMGQQLPELTPQGQAQSQSLLSASPHPSPRSFLGLRPQGKCLETASKLLKLPQRWRTVVRSCAQGESTLNPPCLVDPHAGDTPRECLDSPKPWGHVCAGHSLH